MGLSPNNAIETAVARKQLKDSYKESDSIKTQTHIIESKNICLDMLKSGLGGNRISHIWTKSHKKKILEIGKTLSQFPF
jgi:hypothetical protein